MKTEQKIFNLLCEYGDIVWQGRDDDGTGWLMIDQFHTRKAARAIHKLFKEKK